MTPFLQRLLKHYRFQEMQIPLGVVATDLCTGEPVPSEIPATSSFPFERAAPTGSVPAGSRGGRVLVDGAMSIEIPALLARELGATQSFGALARAVVRAASGRCVSGHRRCFRSCNSHRRWWRQASDLVITPDLRGIEWDGFECGPELVKAGEARRCRCCRD